jgi:hypothetical protein
MRSDTEEVRTTPAGDDEATEIAESAESVESAGGEESGDSETANESVTDDAPDKSTTTKKSRRVSVSVRTLAVSAVIASLIAAVAVMTWLYIGAKATLHEQARQASDDKRAELIALDYAVNAAIMDYKDLGPWKQNLVKGTTPELKDKLSKAGTSMEQILLPLQWSSSARPLAAKVRSHNNGVYIVDTFVSVMTKTIQASDNLQSTATYSITIDSNNAWQITDVGGIAAMVTEK